MIYAESQVTVFSKGIHKLVEICRSAICGLSECFCKDGCEKCKSYATLEANMLGIHVAGCCLHNDDLSRKAAKYALERLVVCKD